MPHLSTTASLSNLGEVMAFIDRSLEELSVSGSHAFAVKLAAEEVCTNIMSYGSADGGAGPLTIGLEIDPRGIVVRIADRGTPFSPDDAPAPDLTSEAEERRIGGLGIHLVKQMMDDVSYTSDPDSGNVLVMTRELKEK